MADSINLVGLLFSGEQGLAGLAPAIDGASTDDLGVLSAAVGAVEAVQEERFGHDDHSLYLLGAAARGLRILLGGEGERLFPHRPDRISEARGRARSVCDFLGRFDPTVIDEARRRIDLFSAPPTQLSGRRVPLPIPDLQGEFDRFVLSVLTPRGYFTSTIPTHQALYDFVVDPKNQEDVAGVDLAVKLLTWGVHKEGGPGEEMLYLEQLERLWQDRHNIYVLRRNQENRLLLEAVLNTSPNKYSVRNTTIYQRLGAIAKGLR